MAKKKQLASLIIATAIIWAVWFPLVTSSNIRMDSDRMLFHAQDALTQYVSEGRSGFVLLLHLFGLTEWHPMLSGVLFLLFFSLSGWILCLFIHLFSGRSDRFPYALFLLIYATTPVWAFHVYFVLQIAAVGFGLLLASLLAGLDAYHHTQPQRNRLTSIFYEIIATCLLGASLTIYQGLIVFYLSACAIFLFCFLWYQGQCKPSQVVLWAFRVLAALLIYFLIGRMTQVGSSSYLMQQIQWGQAPLLQCMMNVAIQFGKMLFLIYSGSTSLYPIAFMLLFSLMFRCWKSKKYAKESFIWLLLTGIIILILPLAMSILQGSRPVPRTQFALQIAAAFIPVFFLAVTPSKQQWLRVLCILAVCLQVALNLRLWHTDNQRHQHDMAIAQTISADLRHTSADSKPLIFMGGIPFEDSTFLMEKTDVYGRSFFEWIYDPSIPGSATSSAVRLLRAVDGKNYTAYDDPALLNDAVQLAATMPAYPDDGYCLETDQYILIKLSP